MFIPRILGAYTSGLNDSRRPSASNPLQNANWYAGMVRFGATVGRAPNSTNLFPGSGPMASWPANLRDMLNGIVATPLGTDFVPVIKMKMVSLNAPPENYTWTDAEAYTDVATGRWDDIYRAMIDAIALAGFEYAIICPSHEFNCSFMHDSVGQNAVTQMSWQQAFSHLAAVLQSQAAFWNIRVDIALCPAMAYGSPDLNYILPDLSNVQIFAIDVFNGFSGLGDYTQPQTRINYWNNGGGAYGMLAHIALAQALGLPVFFCELGTGTIPNSPTMGMLDDAAFINWASMSIKTIRGLNIPFYGTNIWDVDTAPGSYALTTGNQPAALGRLAANLSSFVGDQIT